MQIATTAGTDAERLVKDAALRLLEEDARFRAAVREGIAQADRGELIDEEDMDTRLSRCFAHNAYPLDASRPAADLEQIRSPYSSARRSGRCRIAHH